MKRPEDGRSFEDLERRLAEAEETLDAIRNGDVDALIVRGPQGEEVYSLAAADRPYRLMVECMHEGALTAGHDLTIYYCNSRFAAMLGLPAERVMGRRVDEFVPPAERERLAALVAGTEGTDGEFALGGAELPVKMSAARIDAEGESMSCLVVTDLTEQRHRERLVIEHQRKDEFLAMLAHELRNPLAPISSATQVLKLGGEKLDASQRLEMTQVITRQVEHLTRLVDDLLDVARLTRGTIRLDKRVTDLRGIVERAVDSRRQLACVDHRELKLELAAEPLWVEADPVRIHQVVDNVVSNACKYTHGGGLIEVVARAREGRAILEVRDDGVGIAAEFMPKLFLLFEQADATLDRSRGGLGLGLALVKRLVEMHEGQVWAESPGPGRGSTFTVELPLAEPPGTAVDLPCETSSMRAGGRRLLVVDDNQDAAATLALLLRSEGYETHLAHDGTEALEVARRIHPHAVLLDIGLPGIDGYEVARRLKDPRNGQPLLVALTGYGAREHRQRSVEAGFDHHLVKPVTLDALRTVLASLS